MILVTDTEKGFYIQKNYFWKYIQNSSANNRYLTVTQSIYLAQTTPLHLVTSYYIQQLPISIISLLHILQYLTIIHHRVSISLKVNKHEKIRKRRRWEGNNKTISFRGRKRGILQITISLRVL